jgi:beta-mannosidase
LDSTNKEKILMQKIDLNGKWCYLPDPNSKMDIAQASSGFFSGTNISEVELPSNWELHGLKNFNGTVWYSRDIEIDEISPSTSAFLRFEGVDYFCEVYLNGKFCGRHEGYFGGFFIELPGSNIHIGENKLLVKVTSPLEEPGEVWPLKKKLIKGVLNHHDCRPGGWDLKLGQNANTGGIWNSVTLIITNGVVPARVKVSYEFYNETECGLNIKLKLLAADGEAKKEELKAVIVSPDGEEIVIKRNPVFSHGVNKISLITKISNPQLWYPWDLGEQKLHKVVLYYGGEEIYQEHFGIRRVELDQNKRFFINGKELFLRGTNVIPEQLLSSLSVERIDGMVALLKNANVNIVRVHAHITRKEFYEACDKAGILIWQDFPLQWTYDESPEFTSNAIKQIKEMVNSFYNHPSIVFWCCQNEPGEQVETLDIHLEKAVKEEDSLRIIRRASNYEEHPYDGWYWGTMEHYAGAPMGPLVTEFGAQGLPSVESLSKFLKSVEPPYDYAEWRYHNFQPDQTFNIAGVEPGKSLAEFVENSQNYQAKLLKFAIHQYRRRKGKGITGAFQFFFMDCWQSITWSVVDYFGVPKKGYESVKSGFDPLLLSVFLRQDKYYRGSMLNFEIWVINDKYEDYKDCRIEVLLGDKKLVNIDKFEIGCNSNSHFGQDYFNKIHIPESTQIGKQIFTVSLYSADKKLREEKFEVIIRELA